MYSFGRLGWDAVRSLLGARLKTRKYGFRVILVVREGLRGRLGRTRLLARAGGTSRTAPLGRIDASATDHQLKEGAGGADSAEGAGRNMVGEDGRSEIDERDMIKSWLGKKRVDWARRRRGSGYPLLGAR